MSATVLIRGDGVAACCAAHLLSRSGLRVALDPVARPRLPAILLSRSAMDLIRDVFQKPELFRDLPPVRQRIVQWGAEGGLKALEHSAVVVSEEHLLHQLGTVESVPDSAGEWTIFAADPLPQPCVSNRFGERSARVTPVVLSEFADHAACWIESMEQGWLFLISSGDREAWLISVGEASLAESRVVTRQIACCGDTAGPFAAAPRISSPVCGPGWLACGSAALAFDPLCGDGTAHAIREAILACAVLRAVEGGADSASVLRHYAARLAAGFERHLSICYQYYCSGGTGPWWEAQTAATRQGIDWCAGQIGNLPPYEYRLHGYDLIRVE